MILNKSVVRIIPLVMGSSTRSGTQTGWSHNQGWLMHDPAFLSNMTYVYRITKVAAVYEAQSGLY